MQKNSRTDKIFSEIIELLSIVPEAFINPRGASSMPYKEFLVREREINSRNTKRAISRLEFQNLIQIKKRGESIVIKLTQNGKIEAIKHFIINKEDELPNGITCAVSFDIPEKVRRTRFEIRKLLKQANFKLSHQSLWESNKDVLNELSLLIKILDAEKWVSIYRAEKII